MERCFIFAAGTFHGLYERPREGEDFVIAADAGYHTCREVGIVPDLLIGDFDSMEQPSDFENITRAPVEKDDTDMMLAIKAGLEKECKDFILYGGTGGKRLDHTLANLQALLYLRRHGARGFLFDQEFCWTAMENESLHLFREVEWGLLSLFALGEQAEGVTIVGAQYPLTEGTLQAAFPLGVSNHFLQPEAMIRVKRGAVLVGWQIPPSGGGIAMPRWEE